MKLISRKRYRELLDAVDAAAAQLEGVAADRKVLAGRLGTALGASRARRAEIDRLRALLADAQSELKTAEEDARLHRTQRGQLLDDLAGAQKLARELSAELAVVRHGETTVHVLQRGSKILSVERTYRAATRRAHAIDPAVPADPARWVPSTRLASEPDGFFVSHRVLPPDDRPEPMPREALVVELLQQLQREQPAVAEQISVTLDALTSTGEATP
ncbi:hypothetical protein [Streptomyces sp. NPDC053048]|uniref:hypothetical protein n=1 Tax=Streptomyces sp. NPDC053048 TaxID=3365694 RepID=UPI0037CF41C5